MPRATLRGTVRLKGGRARLYSDPRPVILIPHSAHAAVDKEQKEALGALFFAYLRNQPAVVTGELEDGRLFDARVVDGVPAGKDIRITPQSHDDFAVLIEQVFKKGSEQVARKLNLAGIFTASAFYHRVTNFQPEVDVFAAYLEVPKASINKLLDSIEKVGDTQGLVAAPPKIPVTRGVNLGALAKLSGSKPKKHAPAAPPLFPKAQRSPELPSKVDLSDRVTTVRNQGQERGTCVAHTAAAMLEHELIRYRRHKLDLDLAEQYLYWACKQLDGAPKDDGTFIEYAMQALRDGVSGEITTKPGVCREEHWPYNPAAIPGNQSQGPLPAAARRAPKFKTSKVLRVKENSIKEIKQRLAASHCVGLSVYTYHFWVDGFAWREGVISLPLKIKPDGAHAICLVGYEDRDETHSDGYFIFKNSWGRQWGRQRPDPGYGSLPYRYVLKESIEAWALG